jgi:hypothetical protein
MNTSKDVPLRYGTSFLFRLVMCCGRSLRKVISDAFVMGFCNSNSQLSTLINGQQWLDVVARSARKRPQHGSALRDRRKLLSHLLGNVFARFCHATTFIAPAVPLIATILP